MARFGLWIAALSLVCFIALATSQNASVPSDADITAGCTKYSDANSNMCGSSAITMVFNLYQKYFNVMDPNNVLQIMKPFDTDNSNLLNLSECQNFVRYIIQNAPNTPNTNTN